MAIRFSLLIPTRHRPQFIAQALYFAGNQDYDDFKVVVSDNFEDPAMSCRVEFDKAGMTQAIYVRPAQPLGMVDHWNFILDHADGDYVLYFTDKMFLLPGVLAELAKVIEETRADLISWVDDSFIPINTGDYFGAGYYTRATPGVAKGSRYEQFDPREELSRKGRANVSRQEQSRSAYARGKICFGAYRVDLVAQIRKKYGALFFPISPDYTSMILGLSESQKAVEIAASGIVHVQTDISNGDVAATSDAAARAYLQQIGGVDAFSSQMLVPGLYTTPHNGVTHDYLSLRRKFGLSFDFDDINWLTYIVEDLNAENRIWSSPAEEARQREILQRYLDRLDELDRTKIESRILERAAARESPQVRLKRWIKGLLPPSVLNRLSHISGRRGHYSSSIRAAVAEVYAVPSAQGNR